MPPTDRWLCHRTAVQQAFPPSISHDDQVSKSRRTSKHVMRCRAGGCARACPAFFRFAALSFHYAFSSPLLCACCYPHVSLSCCLHLPPLLCRSLKVKRHPTLPSSPSRFIAAMCFFFVPAVWADRPPSLRLVCVRDSCPGSQSPVNVPMCRFAADLPEDQLLYAEGVPGLGRQPGHLHLCLQCHHGGCTTHAFTQHVIAHAVLENFAAQLKCMRVVSSASKHSPASRQSQGSSCRQHRRHQHS